MDYRLRDEILRCKISHHISLAPLDSFSSRRSLDPLPFLRFIRQLGIRTDHESACKRNDTGSFPTQQCVVMLGFVYLKQTDKSEFDAFGGVLLLLCRKNRQGTEVFISIPCPLGLFHVFASVTGFTVVLRKESPEGLWGRYSDRGRSGHELRRRFQCRRFGLRSPGNRLRGDCLRR